MRCVYGILSLVLTLAAPAFAAGPLTPAAGEQRYVVLFDQAAVQGSDAVQMIAARGGKVVHALPEIGAAIVSSRGTRFMTEMRATPGVVGVSRDLPRQFYSSSPVNRSIDQVRIAKVPGGATLPALGAVDSESSGLGRTVTEANLLAAPFFRAGFQWDLRKIQAPGAWAQGALGDPNVTVTIVGSGIDYTHPELEGKVDLDRSVNFVPEDAALVQELFPGAHPIADLGIHGSYVASLITCNAFGQACVAPNTTIVGVKVTDLTEKGTAGTLALGLVYAGLIGSDVIVLPEDIGKRQPNVPEELVDIVLVHRATQFAKATGAIVLAATWTEFGALGIDADADGNQQLVPQQSGAVAVGATGTEDQWSGLSNFGFSLIDVAAPGGQVDLETVQPPPGIFVFSVGICTSFTQNTRFGPLPDICNKNQPPQYIFSFGVRSAVGFASGVAALIDSEYGGAKRGGFIRSKLLGTADDILAPGRDAVSGAGRVNALRAVTE